MNYIEYVAINADMITYYDKEVGKLAEKYRDKSWRDVKVVVCPLHNDHDASFGLLTDRAHRNMKRYHCFGCGAHGNIIDLHRELVKQNEGRNLTSLESARELAKMFDIDISEDELDAISDSIIATMTEEKERVSLLLANRTRPSVRNYQKNFKQLRNAKEKGASADTLIYNYDKLNLAYKEALIRKE